MGAAIQEIGIVNLAIGVVVFAVLVIAFLRWLSSLAGRLDPVATPPIPVKTFALPAAAPIPASGGLAYVIGFRIGAFRAGLHDGFMVNSDDDPTTDEVVDEADATTTTTPQQEIATTQIDSNVLLLQAKADAVAALVHAKKIG